MNLEAAATTAINDPLAPELDYAALLARVGGDHELAEQLLRQIHGDLPRRLEAVRAAILAGEVEAAHQACHPLKGALLSIQAGPAAEAARRLDEAARAGDPVGARAALPELEGAGRRLEEALTAWLSG